MEEYVEDIEYNKHLKSGIQWDRSFDIKLSHASSPQECSATLGWLSESDELTEQKASSQLHRLLNFFIQLVFKNQKIGNSKYGILVPKGIENMQSVDGHVKQVNSVTKL
jgi:hypothetical protein